MEVHWIEKIEVAERQIKEAIRLFFVKGDVGSKTTSEDYDNYLLRFLIVLRPMNENNGWDLKNLCYSSS
jgi:hypothetical protein